MNETILITTLAYQSTKDLEAFGDFQGEQGNMRQIFRVPVSFIHKVLSFWISL